MVCARVQQPRRFRFWKALWHEQSKVGWLEKKFIPAMEGLYAAADFTRRVANALGGLDSPLALTCPIGWVTLKTECLLDMLLASLSELWLSANKLCNLVELRARRPWQLQSKQTQTKAKQRNLLVNLVMQNIFSEFGKAPSR
mmetsp:Transcript_41772/g.73486  ORF Transcript_41772/g.73486 Transcript_41772/m.73486 type:complete len:142 (+) Transcript_41772:1191-1616(+)